MKTWLSILMSAAIAVGAIGIYDHLRRSEEPVSTEVAVEAPDVGSLEDRLALLEASEEPLLTGRGDEALVRRIEALEQRLRALESTSSSSAPTPAPMQEDPGAPSAATAPAGSKVDGDPTPEALERFRKLRGAASREDRRRYRHKQVAAALEKTNLSLAKDQREALVDALEAFQPRWNEIWSQAKTQAAPAGSETDWSRVIAETEATINREFADSIAEVVPHRGDAEVLSSALMRAGGK